MTALAFRRGGALIAYRFDGDIDPRTMPLPSTLLARRFRTIEHAASEEVSAGWVTPGDPSGDSFDLDDMDAGGATWLRVRVDTKKLPKAIVAQHLAAAAKSKGRPLSARERRELKDDLAEKLLPRVIPSTSNIDALLFSDRHRVLLFGAGKGARDTFTKLFFETFGAPLHELQSVPLAQTVLGSEMAAVVERLEPTRWPVAKGVAS